METCFADPVKQEIWTTVRAMNDAWTQNTAGVAARLAKYFHADMVAITATDRLRLEGRAACAAGWQAFAENTRIHYWRETDPVIKVYGDAALVAYYFDMAFEMAGRTVELGGRDMFFFVKEDGRWQAVADQFSPFPQAG